MKKIVFIFLVFSFIVSDLFAEDIKPFRIGAGLGVSFGGYREETDSAINRYYTNLSLMLDANMEFGKFLHTFNLGFNTGEDRVAKKFEDKYDYWWKYRSYRGYFEYALDYRLWNLSGNGSLPGFLGGAFRTDFYLTETIEIAKYFAILSLGVHTTQRWIINPKHSLSFSATVPVLGYALRSPYSGTDAVIDIYFIEGAPLKILTDGYFASLHNYWALFTDLKYHFQFNPLFSLNAGLDFELSRINIPAPRIDAVTRLKAGVAFTF